MSVVCLLMTTSVLDWPRITSHYPRYSPIKLNGGSFSARRCAANEETIIKYSRV